MTVIRRPQPKFKSLASSQTQASLRMSPKPTLTATDMAAAEGIGTTDIGNAPRAAAGARAGESGFTCARCLTWFPQGTQHACQPYAAVIRNAETPEVVKGPMSAEERALLQADGQL